MYRALLPILAALLLAPPAPAHAFAPLTKVRQTDCRSALDPLGRAAAWEGSMRSMPGAARLQMRFSLQTIDPGDERWRAVDVPGWGTWQSADPGKAGYVVVKRIENLAAPARYRTLVRFRWLDVRGRTLATVRRTSSSCRQTDLRPNLLGDQLEMELSDDPDRARYLIPLVNAGRTDAGPFDVLLTTGGRTLPAEAILGVAAGSLRSLTVEGPRCRPGSEVVVEIDPDNRVDERDEADNRLIAPCTLG